MVIAERNRRSSTEIAAALERAGYSTVEVKTGAEALELARSEDVELLVLEVTLPDMTGFEVCRQIRGDGDEVPIFFVSGTRTDSHDRVAGLLLGADDYMSKPLDPNELVARAHRHVRRRGDASRPPAAAVPTITPRETDPDDPSGRSDSTRLRPKSAIFGSGSGPTVSRTLAGFISR